jgi:UDP-GlcNAc:undecaprenyl-phosphate/decaprenyl-phosphate GlcNAc-1-phosphate transferase
MVLDIKNSAVIVGIVLVVSGLITRLMMRAGILAVPMHRSSHKKATPSSGGVGIISGVVVGLCLYESIQPLHLAPRPWLLIFAFVVLGIVSLVDDIRALNARTKLLAQVLTASLVVASGLSIHHVPLPWLGDFTLGAMGGVITVFWIVVCLNVFNFMDGLNGLASGGSIVANAFLIIIAAMTNQTVLMDIGLVLLPATIGFFIFNFPKAKIFIGDVGSQFLGLVWAVIMLIAAPHTQAFSIYTVPLLFGAFFFDVITTILRRMWEGRRVWEAHRTHLFQILNRSGRSHTYITCVYLVMGALQGLGAIGLQYIPAEYQLWIAVPYIALMTGYVLWVQSHAKKFMRKKLSKR